MTELLVSSNNPGNSSIDQEVPQLDLSLNPYDQVCEEEAPALQGSEFFEVSAKSLKKLTDCVESRISTVTSFFTGGQVKKLDRSVQLVDLEPSLSMDPIIEGTAMMLCQDDGPSYIHSAEISGQFFLNNIGLDPDNKGSFRPVQLGVVNFGVSIDDDLATAAIDLPGSFIDLDGPYDFGHLSLVLNGSDVELSARNEKTGFQVIEGIWSQLPEGCVAEAPGLRCDLKAQLAALLSDSKLDLKKIFHLLKYADQISGDEPSMMLELPETLMKSANFYIDLHPGERVYRYGENLRFVFDEISHLKANLALDLEKGQSRIDFEEVNLVLQELDLMGIKITGELTKGTQYSDSSITPGIRLSYNRGEGNIQAQANLNFNFRVKFPEALPFVADLAPEGLNFEGALLFDSKLQESTDTWGLAVNSTRFKLLNASLGPQGSDQAWLNGINVALIDLPSANEAVHSWKGPYFKIALSAQVPALEGHAIQLNTHLPVAETYGVYDFSGLQHKISFPETDFVYRNPEGSVFQASLNPSFVKDPQTGFYDLTMRLNLREKSIDEQTYSLLEGGVFQWDRQMTVEGPQDHFYLGVEKSPNFTNAEFNFDSWQSNGRRSWSLSARADQFFLNRGTELNPDMFVLGRPDFQVALNYESMESEHILGFENFCFKFNWQGTNYQVSLLENQPSHFNSENFIYSKPGAALHLVSKEENPDTNLILGVSDVFWRKGDPFYMSIGVLGDSGKLGQLFNLGTINYVDQWKFGTSGLAKLRAKLEAALPAFVTNQLPESFDVLGEETLVPDFNYEKLHQKYLDLYGQQTKKKGEKHDD